MKRLRALLISLSFVAFSMIFAATTAQADSSTYRYSSSPIQVDIVDDSGRTLNQYPTDSRRHLTQRMYLEAVKGRRYKLRIRNNSNKRVGVVIAVDGRNILNGNKSYLRNNEKMYVLDPYETSYYKGWRTRKNQVNRFYFTSAGNSYSNAWGDRSAMGVIAVAVFKEKHKYYNHRKKQSRRAPSSEGYLADESTGTGFGEEEYSPTIRVSFKAESKAAFKHFIKYEWRNTLCKQGILDCHHYQKPHEHNRFWPREANNGYAPYPPGYRNRSWSDQFKRGWEYDYKRGW